MSELFISYSRRDSQFADILITNLEQHGFDVWVDREDIPGGDAWRAAISRAIRRCHSFLAVLSPHAVRSKYVARELALADKHNKPIIPILYQPCEIPPEVELQLAGLQMVDFSIQPPSTALDQVVNALRSKQGLKERSALTSTEKQSLTLSQVLPGTWQVQLNVPTPFGVMPGQMMVEMHPNGFFRGQSPAFMVQGQWTITQFNQLVLSGTQTNGFQMLPYQVMLQFTAVTHSQLNGITSGNETAFWQRIQ